MAILSTLLLVPVALPPANDWLDGWDENLRWAVDESVRTVLQGDGEMATLAFFGLDIHKVVSSGNSDVMTLALQPYLTRVDDLSPHPPLFDGPDDWELVWRIFNANLKLRDDGALNARIGHLELPFGIEQVVGTNGTLRDYTHGPNFGFKADWGASLNGEVGDIDYELAWTRGSGNQYRDKGGSGVVSGRVGLHTSYETQFGLSALDGDFLTPAGVTERTRIGIDAHTAVRNFGLMAEVSTGEDGGSVDVNRATLEGNWRNRDETVFSWLQLIGAELDDAHSSEARLGVRWSLTTGLTASAQYAQILDPAASGGPRDGTLALQLRYRF